MSKFTKGPWIYGVRHDGSKWLSIGDYKNGPHYQGDLYASEYDAKLICAAPDLLEALIAMNAQLEADGYMGTTYGPLRIAATKAIAKALA